MQKHYRKTFNYLIQSSKSPGTWDNYKLKQKPWKKFCKKWNLNPYIKHTQETYCCYAIDRFKTTTNKYTSISQDLSAIFSLYNASTFNDPIDRKKFPML